MAKANARGKASIQKASRFSIRASSTQKRVIAEAARIKTQRPATLSSNTLSRRRSMSSLIKCNLDCPKSSGRSSVIRLMRRRRRFLHCVDF